MSLRQLDVLSNLRALILKDVTLKELRAALTGCGTRLSRLELHYMPGVTLGTIASLAPNLKHLSISDSVLDWEEESHRWLPALETCHLMRITYRGGSERLVVSCLNVRELHMEAAHGLSDDWMVEMVEEGKLNRIEQLVVRGQNCNLGFRSLQTLTHCPTLTRLGDLQDWAGLRTGHILELAKLVPGWTGTMYDHCSHSERTMMTSRNYLDFNS